MIPDRPGGAAGGLFRAGGLSCTGGAVLRLLAGSLAVGFVAAGMFPGCGGSESPRAPAPTPTTPAPPPPEPEPEPPSPPACSGLVVEAEHEGVRREEYESFGGSFSIRDESARTAVHLVAPYRDGGLYPPPSWAFIEDFSLREVEGGFERTLEVEWIGELVLEIAAPDCEPFRVRCDAEECVLNPDETTPGSPGP